MDRSTEVQRLAQADRHISDAERTISHQMVEIERQRELGHGAARAEHTLENFGRTLEVMQEHRKIIIRTIEQIDAGLI
jgi:hypothetical protein